MFLCDFEKERENMELARRALLQEKLYEQKTRKTDLLMETSERIKSADFGRSLYEPYSDVAFEGKAAVDLLYYKHMLRNLDESYSKDVQELLAQTYRTIKNIYEFVNIKPCVYGKDVDSKILENSVEKIESKLSGVLMDTVDSLFYSLPPEKRMEKYSDRALPLAKTLMAENNNPEEALLFSIKSCVLEDVLLKVAFPGANWLRVKHLTESEDFGLIFDQQKLVELVETFENQIKVLSNYLAASV